MRMRQPDRPPRGTDLAEDGPHVGFPHEGAGRDVADRLARLPSSHPSAWPAPGQRDAEYRETGLHQWWRLAAAGQDDAAGEQDIADEPDDVTDEPEDTLPGEDADPDEFADQPDDVGRRAVRARAGRRGEGSSEWDELGGPSAASPYRPWFSADGAGDPWFAVRSTR